MPTETRREQAARRQRYDKIQARLAAGEVASVNDLVTYNLDLEVAARSLSLLRRCSGSVLARRQADRRLCPGFLAHLGRRRRRPHGLRHFALVFARTRRKHCHELRALGKRAIGTALKVHLPDEYAETPGVPVEAEVVEIPFRPSANPSAREVAKAAGRDAAV